MNTNQNSKELQEQVIQIDRISRVVAGGRRIRFRVVVVCGDSRGRVGMGVAKANEVVLAVHKAVSIAKKHLISVPIEKNTIPHSIMASFGAANILLKPAPQGTGIIAGGVIRSVANLAGIKNLSAKILGTHNKINNLYATFKALSKLQASPMKEKKEILINQKHTSEKTPTRKK